MTGRVSIDTIREAAGLVYEAAVRTPLVRVELPAALPDGVPAVREIFLKLETLQPVGSFKIRGAYNAVRRLPREHLSDGVWTVSAGNAAQGVALAARLAGVPARVLVMDTTPATKIRALERLGAHILQAPYEECWRTVETGRSDRMTGRLVHPFDDDDVISGHGTIALEIVEQLPDVDAVIAPVGGGGLVAGIAAGLHALRPGIAVYAAEPATAAPLARSLAAGRASRVDEWTASFVDGAGGRSVLESMWPRLRHAVAASIVVGLPEVARAMALVAEHARVIAEGAAACAVAAALSPEIAAKGHTRVVAVVSGGNIDLPRFAALTGACG